MLKKSPYFILKKNKDVFFSLEKENIFKTLNINYKIIEDFTFVEDYKIEDNTILVNSYLLYPQKDKKLNEILGKSILYYFNKNEYKDSILKEIIEEEVLKLLMPYKLTLEKIIKLKSEKYNIENKTIISMLSEELKLNKDIVKKRFNNLKNNANF